MISLTEAKIFAKGEALLLFEGLFLLSSPYLPGHMDSLWGQQCGMWIIVRLIIALSVGRFLLRFLFVTCVDLFTDMSAVFLKQEIDRNAFRKASFGDAHLIIKLTKSGYFVMNG